jgi:hypothetical protein
VKMRDFAVAWNVMWGISYIMVAILAPAVSNVPAFAYVFLGAVLLFCVLVQYIAADQLGRNLAALPLIFLGGLMVWGGVDSWTAATGYWNIPFANLELFHVSMAFADLISAVFLFYNAIALFKNDV